MKFEFTTAGRIRFGTGIISGLGQEAQALGSRALIVTGKSPERGATAIAQLADAGISSTSFSVPGEPTIDVITEGIEESRTADADLIIGMGGGSAIDAAKAIAALATNPGDPLDYLEVIGKGNPLTENPLPSIAVPTTAGTGAEVTKNSVLASPQHGVKVSLRHPLMLPKLVMVDPALTLSMPPRVTAATGLDALTQLIEPLTCCRSNPLTDSLCREGISRVARSLRRAFAEGSNIDAREDMALASLFGGLALANSGLGAVHGFAGPIGGMFPAPHGAVCAALLPHVIRANVAALRQREPADAALGRYQEIAEMLTGSPGAEIEEGVEWVARLCRELEIPSLGTYGIDADNFPDIVEKSARASSMKANPIELTSEELTGILAQAL